MPVISTVVTLTPAEVATAIVEAAKVVAGSPKGGYKIALEALEEDQAVPAATITFQHNDTRR